jgi:hypothetical protein
MAHPHQPYWLWVGGISVTASAALTTAAVTLDSVRSHFSFWTSPITISACVTFAMAVICFICAIREVPFPLARNRSQSSSLEQGGAPDHNGHAGAGLGSTIGEDTQVGGERFSVDGRIFISGTPKTLIAVFKTHTSAQAQKLLEPHYGQWMRVSGALGDVGEWTDNYSRVVFQSSSRDAAVVMIFKDKNVFDKGLSVLHTGVRMTVIGRIERIDSIGVQLADCEIESIGG